MFDNLFNDEFRYRPRCNTLDEIVALTEILRAGGRVRYFNSTTGHFDTCRITAQNPCFDFNNTTYIPVE